jgi:hypothetical protein
MDKPVMHSCKPNRVVVLTPWLIGKAVVSQPAREIERLKEILGN